MDKTTYWIPKTDHQLVATFPGTSEEVTRYDSLLRQWQSLNHPAILELEHREVNLSSEGVLEVTIIVKRLVEFNPCQSKLITLTALEKLWLVKQTLDLDIYVQKQDLKLGWPLARLYLHQAGGCGWLPPLPMEVEQSGQSKAPLIRFLLALFDLEITDVTGWHDLMKTGQIPWEWGAFIEYYLASPTADNNLLKTFTFVFYQAWLYTTANRLSLKDQVLTRPDYQILYQFGKHLGLTDKQIEQLNILAQQQSPDWKDLVNLASEVA